MSEHVGHELKLKSRLLEDIKEVVKRLLLIERLELEDITAEEIADDLILFGDGLGLDSIEGFEIMVGMEEVYGVKVEEIPQDELRDHLATVNSIASFIAASLSEQT